MSHENDFYTRWLEPRAEDAGIQEDVYVLCDLKGAPYLTGSSQPSFPDV